MKPLPLLPTNYKFLTNSLPNSPRIGGVSQPRSTHSPLTCASDTRLNRSKSGGEERSSVPYGGFDLWANLNNTAEHKPSKKHGNNDTKMAKEVKKNNEMDFKCGALCLFLPGFGKGKPVKASRVQPQGSRSQVVSNRISLEDFECGSWRSSAIHSDDDPSAMYFDLPLELIRTSVSDNASPMNSTFVFNKGCHVKGVLKTKGGPVERKSQDGRHVRFSTSSTTITQPTSPITPRLRKARDDFNAFLEAQSV